MNGFRVESRQLRNAAEAARSAADQARRVAPGSCVEVVAQALPGGDAESAATALASTFDERAARWADEIGQWGESVLASATAYTVNEHETASAFGRTPGR